MTTFESSTRSVIDRVIVANGPYYERPEFIIQAETPEFYEANLEGAAPPGFRSPPCAGQLAADLLRHRLLVLGGPDLTEKIELARHLAWLVKKDLGSARDDDQPPAPVLEVMPGTARVRLLAEMEKRPASTVFLLSEAEPFHVDHDLAGVAQKVFASEHYLLITTQKSREAWGVAALVHAAPFWRELAARDVSPPAYLALLLWDELRRRSAELPGDLPAIPPEPTPGNLGRPWIESLSLLGMVSSFSRRGQVLALVRRLITSKRTPTDRWVKRQVHLLTGEKAAVRAWYQQLGRREQFLAVGCMLFDQLYDDQIFAALDLLVEQVWRLRQPDLACFDYQDLHALDAYFSQLVAADGATLVGLSVEGVDRELMATVWENARRLLMSAVPLLSELVQRAGRHGQKERRRHGGQLPLGELAASAEREYRRPEAAFAPEDDETDEDAGSEDGNSTPQGSSVVALSRFVRFGPERELFASTQRRRHFCSVVSRTLARLGIQSLSAVERCLFELACHQSWEAQEVAARALDAWRDSPRERDLESILNRWYSDSLQREGSLPIEGSQRERQRQGSLRATLGLVVALAAQRIAPGKLPPAYLRFCLRLANDRNSIVRARLRGEVVPALVLLHQQQADLCLRGLAPARDLADAIAWCWAETLATHPKDAGSLLDAWFEAGQRGAEGRAGLLGTVALTYGYLNFRAPTCRISMQLAVSRLRELLRDSDPALRRQVFQAIGLLIGRSFPELKGSFPELIAALPIQDRGEILRPLLTLHRRQRIDLGAGDDLVEAEGRLYPVWGSRRKPLTGVEAALEEWVLSPSSPVVQQLSFVALCSMRLGPLGVAEARWRSQRGLGGVIATAEVRGQTQLPPSVTSEAVRRPPPGLARVIFAIVSVGQPTLRRKAAWLVPEVLVAEAQASWVLLDLLATWNERGGEHAQLGRLLRLFRLGYLHRARLLLGALVLGILTLAGLAAWMF